MNRQKLIARLLAEIGFEDIEVAKRSDDGGIDVRGTLVVGDVICITRHSHDIIELEDAEEQK